MGTGGEFNEARGSATTILGGSRNSICDECTDSTIVGGASNGIGGSESGTIGGGSFNFIEADFCTIVGGQNNACFAENGVIGGGKGNTVGGDYAVIGGGQDNVAEGKGSTIPGGRNNRANGDFSIAFGRNARANDDQSLVINLQTGDGKLSSTGKKTWTSAAKRYIFQIGNQQAIINKESISILQDILEPERRNLRGEEKKEMMTPAMIRELIQEQKNKHEEQQGTKMKLQKELTSLVKEQEEQRGLVVDDESSYDIKELSQPERALKKKKVPEPDSATNAGGDNNSAVGNGAVVNGGQNNEAIGSVSVVGGGRGNIAVGSGSSVGGGDGNGALSTLSTIGGGTRNVVSGEVSFIGGGFENKISNGFNTILGGEKNQVKKKWSTILGGKNNVVKGDYAVAMGQNALVKGNYAMAIGLDPDSKKKVIAAKSGDWIVRAKVIELRIGSKSFKLDGDNIKKFKLLLTGQLSRRSLAADSEARTLMKELEDVENLVDILDLETDEIQYDIDDILDEQAEALEIENE